MQDVGGHGEGFFLALFLLPVTTGLMGNVVRIFRKH